jgi:serine phosphatase RsbU (regulator of sigma subunit)
VLVVYTDGITEAFNAAYEEFGEHRLIDVLTRNRHRTAREMLTAIVDDVLRFSPHEQRDDITLIVARCKEAETKRAGKKGPREKGPRVPVRKRTQSQ